MSPSGSIRWHWTRTSRANSTGTIENHVGFLINPDSPRHPHSATGYLRTEFVRDPVRETVGSASLQSISPFALAKDLVSVLEDGHSAERHEVLIQLAVGDKGPANIDEIANDVEARIRSMVREGQSGADPEVERLRHFVVARLTRQELETLRCHWPTCGSRAYGAMPPSER